MPSAEVKPTQISKVSSVSLRLSDVDQYRPAAGAHGCDDDFAPGHLPNIRRFDGITVSVDTRNLKRRHAADNQMDSGRYDYLEWSKLHRSFWCEDTPSTKEEGMMGLSSYVT
jgi:hypothetical protein